MAESAAMCGSPIVGEYVAKVRKACSRANEDPSKWRIGSELQDMEEFLLKHNERLLLHMEDELCIEERKAVARAVRGRKAQ